jgi:F-type H+-transporting ATPase subunit epsilon
MATATPTKRQLRCVIVTPERALFDEAADFVALPLFDGEIGFLPGRAPLVGRMGCGELRIKQGNNTLRFYVDGGFVQVRADVVSVLTARALPAVEVTADRVREAEEKAAAAKSPDERLKAEARTRAMERMARRLATA